MYENYFQFITYYILSISVDKKKLYFRIFNLKSQLKLYNIGLSLKEYIKRTLSNKTLYKYICLEFYFSLKF